MKEQMNQVLFQIGRALNKEKIIWGLGASLVLYGYGLVDSPSDIDILVTEKDMDRAVSTLSKLGSYREGGKTEVYLTEGFFEFTIQGIEVDLMAGFKIKNHGLIYDYTFDENSIPHHLSVQGEKIPYGTLEDWLILYYMIPGRENKFHLIRDYLKKNGLSYPDLLKRSSRKALPKELQNLIVEIL